MPLTSIVACQIFAIADAPGRREELPPPPLSQAFVSLIFDGGFMNNTNVGQFGNLSKRTAGLEVLAEGRLTRNLHWDLRLEQRFDEYDFAGTGVLDGGNPNDPAGDDFDTSDQPWQRVHHDLCFGVLTEARCQHHLWWYRHASGSSAFC